MKTTKEREAARRNTRMRFEQWAKNPVCMANTVSAVHNVRMADVATAEGATPSFGQSPFALQRGQGFERRLFQDDAARLYPELLRTEVLPADASDFLDLRLRMNGGSRLRSLDEAVAETEGLLHRVAAEDDIPALVAGATVVIPRGVMLPEAVLILDALAIRVDDGKPTLQVGEIKTYPDRGGHTDPEELATARAQGGVYVEALRLVIERLGLDGSVSVSEHGFLVLSRPGSDFPSVRAGEDLRWQAQRAARGFAMLERAAQALDPIAWEDATDTTLVELVQNSETEYREACLSFCDRAPVCHRRALEEGNPAVLGDDVHRFVGDITLTRVVQLFHGDTPADLAEMDLMRRVHEAGVAKS